MRRKLIQLAEKLGSPGVKVLATYGFTEARMAWGECPAPRDNPSGYHIPPGLAHIETC